MKPLYDVNDNAQNIKTEPTKEYESINNTTNTSNTIIKRQERQVKEFIQFGFLIIILIILLFMLIFGVKVGGSKDIGQETFYSTNENFIDTYNVHMEIREYSIDNNVVNVTLEIVNNSKNNIYITAKGIYLTSTNNVYCPNVLTTNISSKFYGQPIKSGETIMAVLTYNGVIDEPSDLVVSNIIDKENLAWTNAISIN